MTLLVLIPLLRIPSFLSGFFLPEESMLLLLGNSLSEGQHLYSDVWFAGPPLLPWLFMMFHEVFGSWTLPMIRILSCLYIYIASILFNGILIEYKLYRRYSGFTAIMIAFLVSVPWYSQQMSGSLFVLLPMIISFYQIMQLGDNRSKNYQLMFGAGVWMAISMCITYKAIFIFFGLLIAYVRVRRPSLDELISMVGGMVVVFLFVLNLLYFNDSLRDFWDIGVLYYLDRLRFSSSPVYAYELSSTLTALLIAWGPVLVLGLIGFLHFRIRYFSYVVKIRATETITSLWLLGVLLMLLFKWQRLELSDLVLLVPPLVFYMRKALDLPFLLQFRWGILALILVLPLFLYIGLWNLRHPNPADLLRPAQEDLWIHGGTWMTMRQEGALFEYLADQSPESSIWIMDYKPAWYLSLGTSSLDAYTDFRILYHKLPLFQSELGILFSKEELERNFYQRFQASPPDLIVDPQEYFHLLQDRFPAMLGKYEVLELDGVAVYHKKE